MSREVVGGRARGGRHQHAVADELGHARLAVDLDPELRRLVALPPERDLVDGLGDMHTTLAVARPHGERMDHGPFGRREPLRQPVLEILVHEEADRAPVHAVDRRAAAHRLVQRLQHHAVAAERDHDVGLGCRRVAIAGDKRRMGRLRVFRGARQKGDPLKPLAIDHGHVPP